ncbi:unnamed protein product [Amoebophrya sp. A120]|nr:unnamed protein product [Amoebophrya sp. A120]|eukprot:GSA120T00023933001.1
MLQLKDQQCFSSSPDGEPRTVALEVDAEASTTGKNLLWRKGTPPPPSSYSDSCSSSSTTTSGNTNFFSTYFSGTTSTSPSSFFLIVIIVLVPRPCLGGHETGWNGSSGASATARTTSTSRAQQLAGPRSGSEEQIFNHVYLPSNLGSGQTQTFESLLYVDPNAAAARDGGGRNFDGNYHEKIVSPHADTGTATVFTTTHATAPPPEQQTGGPRNFHEHQFYVSGAAASTSSAPSDNILPKSTDQSDEDVATVVEDGPVQDGGEVEYSDAVLQPRIRTRATLASVSDGRDDDALHAPGQNHERQKTSRSRDHFDIASSGRKDVGASSNRHPPGVDNRRSSPPATERYNFEEDATEFVKPNLMSLLLLLKNSTHLSVELPLWNTLILTILACIGVYYLCKDTNLLRFYDFGNDHDDHSHSCKCPFCTKKYEYVEEHEEKTLLGKGGYASVFLIRERGTPGSAGTTAAQVSTSTTPGATRGSGSRGNKGATDKNGKNVGGGSASPASAAKTTSHKPNYIVAKRTPKIENIAHLQRIQQEAKELRRLQHPNVVAYIDDFVHNKDSENKNGTTASATSLSPRGSGNSGYEYYLIMEYCDRGDLKDHIDNYYEWFTEFEVFNYLQQLVAALAYCHSKNVIHRDVKSQNVFLTSSPGASTSSSNKFYTGSTFLDKIGPLTLKLGDFGLSSSMGNSLPRPAGGPVPAAAQFQNLEQPQLHSQVGTDCYKAPELLGRSSYGREIDVWGIGCVLFELLTGDFLWDLQDIKQRRSRVPVDYWQNHGEQKISPATASPREGQLHKGDGTTARATGRKTGQQNKKMKNKLKSVDDFDDDKILLDQQLLLETTESFSGIRTTDSLTFSPRAAQNLDLLMFQQNNNKFGEHQENSLSCDGFYGAPTAKLIHLGVQIFAEENYLQRLLQANYPHLQEKLPVWWLKLLKKCLQKEPSIRPKCDQIAKQLVSVRQNMVQKSGNYSNYSINASNPKERFGEKFQEFCRMRAGNNGFLDEEEEEGPSSQNSSVDAEEEQEEYLLSKKDRKASHNSTLSRSQKSANSNVDNHSFDERLKSGSRKSSRMNDFEYELQGLAVDHSKNSGTIDLSTTTSPQSYLTGGGSRRSAGLSSSGSVQLFEPPEDDNALGIKWDKRNKIREFEARFLKEELEFQQKNPSATPTPRGMNGAGGGFGAKNLVSRGTTTGGAYYQGQPQQEDDLDFSFRFKKVSKTGGRRRRRQLEQ